METTDRCIHCNALLPETMLAPAYCDQCEDERAAEADWEALEAQEGLYTAWEILGA